MLDVIEVAGLLASVTGFLGGLPHALRVWRNRDDLVQLGGISLASQYINLSGQLFWGTYGIGTGSLWVVLPCLVNGPIALLTITVIQRAQRRAVAAPRLVLVPADRVVSSPPTGELALVAA